MYLDLPFRVKDVKATLICKLKEAVKNVNVASRMLVMQ